MRSRTSTLRFILAGRSAKIGIGLVAAVLVFVLIASLATPYSPDAIVGDPNSPPTLAHLFGTDYIGHDLLSQVAWGAFPSLFVSLYISILSTMVGFLAGIVSGYYERMESVVGLLTDVTMSFPPLPLLITIGSIFSGDTTLIDISLIFVMWALVSRAVRSQTARAKKLAFVDAAKASGMPDRRIVSNVMMPLVLPIAVAYFVINLALALILITSLQFLGVGNPLLVNWGSILYWAELYGFSAGDWWWILFPGLLLSLTTIGFAFFGFSLEEFSNPRLRRAS